MLSSDEGGQAAFPPPHRCGSVVRRHRAFEIDEEHRHLLPIPFRGCAGRHNLLLKVGWGVGQRAERRWFPRPHGTARGEHRGGNSPRLEDLWCRARRGQLGVYHLPRSRMVYSFAHALREEADDFSRDGGVGMEGIPKRLAIET